MIGFLRKLFGGRNKVEHLARGSDPAAFVRALGEADVYVFAEMDGDGLDPRTFTQEQLLAEIERVVKDLSERESFKPFVYTQSIGGVERRRLPFFTSEAHAHTFVGELSREHDRVFPMQALGIKGATLAQLLPGCDELVMNDGSPGQVVLGEQVLDLIRRSRA